MLILVVMSGCVSTTTKEVDAGAVSTRVEEYPLREPPGLEARVERHGDAVRMELSRFQWCNRREIDSVPRARVERSRPGLGTSITSGAIMGVGLLATSGLIFVGGGVVLGIAALRSGTTKTPLPDRELPGTPKRVACKRRPAPNELVEVTVGDERYPARSDAVGVVELNDVRPGKLHASVAGMPVRLRAAKRRRGPERVAEAGERAGALPASPPRPASSRAVAVGATRALPPPPPPPPGARVTR